MLNDMFGLNKLRTKHAKIVAKQKSAEALVNELKNQDKYLVGQELIKYYPRLVYSLRKNIQENINRIISIALEKSESEFNVITFPLFSEIRTNASINFDRTTEFTDEQQSLFYDTLLDKLEHEFGKRRSLVPTGKNNDFSICYSKFNKVGTNKVEIKVTLLLLFDNSLLPNILIDEERFLLNNGFTKIKKDYKGKKLILNY